MFVVGSGRSGSSALARVLSLCGAALPRELLPGNAANPTGYWEPERALDINDRFMARYGSSWDDPVPALQLRPLPTAERRRFVDEIASFLTAGFHDGAVAILKEPRISILLPYWLSAAEQVGCRSRLVLIFRDPTEFAASLEVRDAIDRPHALALWMKYNVFAERDSRLVPRTFVSYEGLLDDWERTIRHCARDLDLTEHIRVTDDARDAVAEFLRRDLRHHDRATLPPVGSDAPLIERTYALLRAAERDRADADGFNAVRREFIAGPPPEVPNRRLVRRTTAPPAMTVPAMR